MSKYSCEKCKYYTNIKQHYNIHINTNKHKNSNENRNENRNENNNENPKEFECEKCNKKFETNSGLWKHKKNCNVK